MGIAQRIWTYGLVPRTRIARVPVYGLIMLITSFGATRRYRPRSTGREQARTEYSISKPRSAVIGSIANSPYRKRIIPPRPFVDIVQ
jgi:hypothetical protein